MGKERKLSRRCGTPPYIAPEVGGGRGEGGCDGGGLPPGILSVQTGVFQTSCLVGRALRIIQPMNFSLRLVT